MKREQESAQRQTMDSGGSVKDTRQSPHSSTQQTQTPSQMNNEADYDGPQYLWKYQLLLQSKRNGYDLGDGIQSATTQIQISSQIEQHLRDEIECYRKEIEQLQRELQKVQNNCKQILLIHSAGQIQNNVENTLKKLKIERATSEVIIFQSDLNEEVALKRQISQPNEDISLILSEKQIQHDLLISKHQQQECQLTAFKLQYKAIQNRLDEVVRLSEAKEREIKELLNLVQLKDQQILSLNIHQQTVVQLQIQLQSTNQQLKEYKEKHYQLNTKYQGKKKQYKKLVTELQIAKNKDDMTKINNCLTDAKKQNSKLQAALKIKQGQIKWLQKDILRIRQQLAHAQKQLVILQNDLKNSQDANSTMKRELKFAEEKAKSKEDELKKYTARDQSDESVKTKNKNLEQALRECQNKLKSAEQVVKINKCLQEALRECQEKMKTMKQENMEYLNTIQRSQNQKSQLLQQLIQAQNLQENTMEERKSSVMRTNQVISQKRQMENQIIEQKKRHNQLEANLTNEKKKTAQYQAKINDHTRINNENIKKINSLEAACKAKDIDLKAKQVQLQKLNKKITSLETTLSNKEADLLKKIEIIKTQQGFQIKNKKLQANLKAKQSELQSKQKMITVLKQQNEEMKIADKKMKESFKKQIQQFKKEKENCQQYINRVEQQSATLEKQRDNLSANLHNLSVKFDNLSAKLQQTLYFIKTVEKQVLCQQIIDRQNITDNDIELVIDRLNGLKYFPDSQILSNSPLTKHKFLCYNLKRFLQIQTFQTKLIYKYPTLDTTNFHTYFDNKSNLVIMVKLANGTIIGGFTVNPFLAERVPNGNRGQGFLFSLTAEKTFKMRIDPRQSITTYDHFFLILGNAEIRLRAGEKKVFSNFGIATSTFDNVGYPRTSFLGVQDQTNNELDIESYEIFQVLMEKGH